MSDQITQLMDAVRAAPQHARAWIALGEALYDARRLSDAASVFAEAAQLHAGNVTIAAFRGLIAQGLGDPDTAISHYDLVLKVAPSDKRTRHNRANALRSADRVAEALAEVEATLAQGAPMPDTLALRGHLLTDLGRLDEAVDQYQAVIKEHPDHIDTQDTLARLLPQIGQRDAAFDAVNDALSLQPQNLALWHAALKLAHDFRNGPVLADLCARARQSLGLRPELSVFQASASGFSGDVAAAVDGLRGLVSAHPDDPGLQTQLAHWLLCTHDFKAAERHAIEANQLDAITQTGWSLLTIIWRMLGDAREDWLADYERLVMPVAVDLPPMLEADLHSLHTLQQHPSEHSLRNGTQTRGYLFDKRLPSIQKLGQNIMTSVNAQIAELPDDPSHPFLSRNTQRIGFTTAWSVRLASSGFHINHFHPQGWLSSALYIALPPVDEAHGALTFGVPDSAFGLDLAPRRVEVPQPGRLVIFPSYLWHGTLPFDSETSRLTVAFDAIPQ